MSSFRAPVFTPPANWKPIHLPYNIGSGRNFPDTVLRMAFYSHPESQKLVGKVWLGEQLAGPPGHVHGGAAAYVLDEACGTVAWAQRYPVVARNLKIDFLKMIPTHADLDIEAKIVKVEDRDVIVEAKIFDASQDIVFTQGFGTFARLRKEKMKTLSLLEQSGFDVSQFIFPTEKKK